jgi:predicted nucleotide-binding protein
MARFKKPGTPEPEPPAVPAVQGIKLLDIQIAKAQELLQNRPLSSDGYSKWELLTRNYLEKAFGRHSPNINSVMEVGKYGAFPMNAGEQWWEGRRAQSLETQIHQLKGLRELLETEIQLSKGETAAIAAERGTGRKIFLVHGHDHQALHEAARFLERLKQEVIVLREQPNEGRTVIEKFEDYADVGFAVILLTPDDLGNSKAAAAKGTLNARARQNVVFELGYFIGRLGRNRVCALYVEGIEIPSDYSGVLYTKLDASGGWRLELAKELKAAGLPVDMNLAL